VDRLLPLHVLLIVRVRRALARTLTRRVVVVVAAVVTAVAVSGMIRSAEQTRSRWADTRQVVVAQRDLAPGDVVDAGAVTQREVPSAAVAEAASDVLPLGAVVRYPIAAGEPVVASRLAPQGLTGVAALVPDGQRAVAIPTGPAGMPPVQTGDRVDVVAFDPGSAEPEIETDVPEQDEDEGPSTSSAPATTLVDQALVVTADDTAVTVAVPAELAPTVAYGAAQGLVVLTLVGG
jgi:Flp pilus assembly protein CpaB